ncbi:keratinocyte proline-rich protein-like [Venturia canescens]|uniref:keratinocyte proline-rich protein-like n=1 Tax=Venturia canescens TaxID=32260 RepID=UPI001C9D1819|nr:keratinocyte proline-rich protein-like [Venturia canescens]
MGTMQYVIFLGLLTSSAVFCEEAATKQAEDAGKDTKTKRGLELGDFGGFEHGGGFDGIGLGGGGGGDHGKISAITIHREVKVPVPAPYTVEKKIPVPYPVHVKVPVDHPVPVHVPAPYPVHVEKHVPYPVEKPVPYPVKVPVKVPYKVPYPVEVPVKVPVPVHKEVPYPVKVPYYVKESYPVYVHAKHGHEDGGYASGFGYGGGHEHFDFGHH